MEEIFSELNPHSIIDLEDVITFLETHPEVVSLNSEIVQKNWRTNIQ
jgi:hypothetical protein